ncbi:hypothetical protein HDU84_002385 [Entophlyctis sp. JEL0112]|nr:hypothetical protein HDU84_002385 [Entophlyctis sp. JEL0112]
MEHPHPEGIAERPLDLQDNSSASLQPLLLPDTQRVVDTLVTQIAESAENEEHNSSHLSSDAQRIARKSSQDTYNDEAQHYEHGSDGFAQTVATAVRYSMAGSPGGSIQQANVSKSGAISRRHLACTWANDIKSLISNHKREHKRKLSKIRDEDAEFRSVQSKKPSPSAVSKAVQCLYHIGKEAVKERLKKASGRLYIGIDIWQSPNVLSILGMLVFYRSPGSIDIKELPLDFKMQESPFIPSMKKADS